MSRKYLAVLFFTLGACAQDVSIEVDDATQRTAPLSTLLMGINAGGPQLTTAGGQSFVADRGFIGGSVADRGNVAVANTANPALYRTERYAMTGYRFAVPNGEYQVRLHFAETYLTAPGQRVFDVAVENQTLSSIDVVSLAGGANRALVLSANVRVSDGAIDLGFTPRVQQPMINAIEIATRPAVRVNAGGVATVVGAQTWDADGYFTGGGVFDRGAVSITNGVDARLYQTARTGEHAYSVPVPNGLYEVCTHFAETYPGIDAAGKRVFALSVEGGAPVSIDVFQRAGGANRGTVRADVVTVRDGALDLSLTNQTASAFINAFEVLPRASTDVGSACAKPGNAPPAGYQFPSGGVASSRAITTVSTFQSVSLYWKASTGSDARKALVRYRQAGSTTWLQGHPAHWDGRSPTASRTPTAPERANEYRASLVELRAGATYEVEMYVEGSGEKRSATATTWPDALPEGQTVRVTGNRSTTLVINSGGTPDAYLVYDFVNGATIDVAHGANFGVELGANARYVIIRGATIKNANMHGIVVGTAPDDGAMPLVVVENCDISGWGSKQGARFGRNSDAAVGSWNSRSRPIERLVVQNNKLHHPATDSNNWFELHDGYDTYHPMGPQAVAPFYVARGNIVVRYNSIWSDATHMFNDGIGSVNGNFSFKGFLGNDSDVYGNDVSHVWDDAIEADGADCNLRVWNNVLTETFNYVSTAVVSVGPFYAWRNVGVATRKMPGTGKDTLGVANKNRIQGNDETNGVEYGGGWQFWYHNTFPRSGTTAAPVGAHSSFYSNEYQRMVGRNNVLNAWSYAVRGGTHPTNTFDYNVYTGATEVPGGSMANSTSAVASFKSGTWELVEGTPGSAEGAVIPNFTGTFAGAQPDVGAVQAGRPMWRHGAR